MGNVKRYFELGEVFRYFLRVFRKAGSGYPTSANLRTMHWINRVSIVMFLFCVLVMIIRAILR